MNYLKFFEDSRNLLEKSYETLETLENKIKKTSLIKISIVEKNWSFFSLSRHSYEELRPNVFLLDWIGGIVLSIYEDLKNFFSIDLKEEWFLYYRKSIFNFLSELEEFSVFIDRFSNSDFSFFQKKFEQNKELNLHLLENFIVDKLINIMIDLQKILENLKNLESAFLRQVNT